MQIALVQVPMETSIKGNLQRILAGLASAKALGAQVAVFPECVLTGYHPEMGGEISPSVILAATLELSDACKTFEISALVGMPFYKNQDQIKPYNAIVVFDETGEIVQVCPKVLFTPDEIVNDIYQLGDPTTRTTFVLHGMQCAILVCVEFAGMVGNLISKNCYDYLSALPNRPEIVFVPGVMDLGPDSGAHPLAVQTAQHFNAHFVVVNASHWGFGIPAGCLGGSFAIDPNGQTTARALYNQEDVALANVEPQSL